MKQIILLGICVLALVGCSQEAVRSDTFIIEDEVWGNVTLVDENITVFNKTMSLKDDFVCTINHDRGWDGCRRSIGEDIERCTSYYLDCSGKGTENLEEIQSELASDVIYGEIYEEGKCPHNTTFRTISYYEGINKTIEIC